MKLRDRQGAKPSLDIDVLSTLFKSLEEGGTKGIVIEGGGEPCLHKDFDRVVKTAKNSGLAVGLITNGTISLSSEILSCFEWIRVSLDASTKKEYLSLKNVDLFEDVLENITEYAKHCNTVGVGYVVTNNNIEELESLVLQLRENGVSYIQLRPVVDSPELYPKETDLQYLKYYQTISFGVIIDGMAENIESGNFGLGCSTHSLTSVITADGSVYLCGRLNIYDWMEPIGNINTESFDSIWLGDKRKEQTHLVIDKSFCSKNCPQCRISKFNKLILDLNSIESKNFI